MGGTTLLKINCVILHHWLTKTRKFKQAMLQNEVSKEKTIQIVKQNEAFHDPNNYEMLAPKPIN